MSSLRVGAEVPLAPAGQQHELGGAQPRSVGNNGEGDGGSGGALEAAMARLAKWIPGDALAIYAAAVTAFAAKSGSQPSVVLLIIGIALAGGLVPLGAFAAKGSIPKSSLLPAVLAAFAFTIWSLSMPLSGWQSWHLVHDNQAAVAVGAAILALVFCLVAEGLTKKFGGSK